MIICDKCGNNYRRKTTPYKHVWQCSNYLENGKEACAAKQVPEDILIEITCEVIGLKEFDEVIFKDKVKSIMACDENTLVFKLADETEVKKQWKSKSRSESWTPEKRELARLRELKRIGETNGKNNSNSINN